MSRLVPNLNVKTAKTYQKRAGEIVQNVKDELISSFSKSRKVCLTLDHWSSHHKGYLGATAHWFVQSEDKLERSACIALRRITGRVTYDVLGCVIEDILAEYGVLVSHCVTDSGSNFVKAFKEYAPSIADADQDAGADSVCM